MFYDTYMRRNHKGQYVKGLNGRVFEGFGVWSDAKGYPCIWIDGKSIKVHVYVWERSHGIKPVGFDVHHIDFDKSNYSEGNLELVSKSDHLRIHVGWVKDEGGMWSDKPCTRCGKVLPLGDFYPRKGHTPSALCRVCHNITVVARNATPEMQEKLKTYKRNWHQSKKKEAQNA